MLMVELVAMLGSGMGSAQLQPIMAVGLPAWAWFWVGHGLNGALGSQGNASKHALLAFQSTRAVARAMGLRGVKATVGARTRSCSRVAHQQQPCSCTPPPQAIEQLLGMGFPDPVVRKVRRSVSSRVA